MKKTKRIITATTFLLGISISALSLAAEPPADQPAIRVLSDKSNRPYAFEAVGLSAEQLAMWAKSDDSHERFSRTFSVYVVEKAKDGDLPALAGSYSVEASSLLFTPRFSFR